MESLRGVVGEKRKSVLNYSCVQEVAEEVGGVEISQGDVNAMKVPKLRNAGYVLLRSDEKEKRTASSRVKQAASLIVSLNLQGERPGLALRDPIRSRRGWSGNGLYLASTPSLGSV